MLHHRSFMKWMLKAIHFLMPQEHDFSARPRGSALSNEPGSFVNPRLFCKRPPLFRNWRGLRAKTLALPGAVYAVSDGINPTIKHCGAKCDAFFSPSATSSPPNALKVLILSKSHFLYFTLVVIRLLHSVSRYFSAHSNVVLSRIRFRSDLYPDFRPNFSRTSSRIFPNTDVWIFQISDLHISRLFLRLFTREASTNGRIII